ncbi:hypothetical protein NQ318_003975 [Aromia moschata]|uniref:Uncharacterized protein n=1 Tax=Aromia moschata TaxID=1265417 RepID=A0AAV8Z7S1_9CUCU|nr:hypothetical protein NQ318_003975 [Aromia moschata]
MAVTGKVGTDIQQGRCSWLAVVALQRANATQKKIMEEYYGRPEPESVDIIKNLYLELSLPTTYAAFEEEALISFILISNRYRRVCRMSCSSRSSRNCTEFMNINNRYFEHVNWYTHGNQALKVKGKGTHGNQAPQSEKQGDIKIKHPKGIKFSPHPRC